MSFQTMNAILRMGRRAQAALAAVLLLGASLCAVQAQEIVYYHTDALGTPVAMTNANGAVIQRREFEPYGRQLDPAVLADGPGFTGHVADAATGLVYMQQRYYDPGIGAFLSTDPVTALKGPFNRYWYANENPYRFKDPDGRKCSTVDGKNSCTFDEYGKDKEGKPITREQADQTVSSSAIVKAMESMLVVAEAGNSPKDQNGYRYEADVPSTGTGAPSNGPITFWRDGSTADVGQIFGHEALHGGYSGVGVPNFGWANSYYLMKHQAPFNEASDEIK